VIGGLKGEIVEPEEMAVARQWRCKHVSAAPNTQVAIEERWEVAVVSRDDGRRVISVVSSRYPAKISDDKLTNQEDSVL
jgi:hypothetical protein